MTRESTKRRIRGAVARVGHREESLKKIRTLRLYVYDQTGHAGAYKQVPIYLSTLVDLAFVMKVPEHICSIMGLETNEVIDVTAEGVEVKFKALQSQYHSKMKASKAEMVILVSVDERSTYFSEERPAGSASISMRYERAFRIGTDIHYVKEQNITVDCSADDPDRWTWPREDGTYYKYVVLEQVGNRQQHHSGTVLPYSPELMVALSKIEATIKQASTTLQETLSATDATQRLLGSTGLLPAPARGDIKLGDLPGGFEPPAVKTRKRVGKNA